mgnify:CR=1 FL=1
MKILISNDDGVNAPGIAALHQALADSAITRFVLPGKGVQRQPPLLQLRLAVFATQTPMETEDQALQIDVGQIATGGVLFVAQSLNRRRQLLTGLPTGASFDADTLELIWTPGYAQAGTYYVTVKATDDGKGHH